jgi:hypothetical protein
MLSELTALNTNIFPPHAQQPDAYSWPNPEIQDGRLTRIIVWDG